MAPQRTTFLSVVASPLSRAEVQALAYFAARRATFDFVTMASIFRQLAPEAVDLIRAGFSELQLAPRPIDITGAGSLLAVDITVDARLADDGCPLCDDNR